MRQEGKIKRENKKKGGGWKEGGLPPTKPSPTRFGGVLPPWTRPTPLGLLEPQGKVPSLPPIYTEVLGLIRDDFPTAARPHTSTVFPLDRVSAELWRSPAETKVITNLRSTVTLPENSSTSPSLLLDQEGRDHRRAVRVLNAEVPSVRY